MRGMWFFAIGLLAGAVATVMFMTLTDLPGRKSTVNAGIGDARVVLGEHALETLIGVALIPLLDQETPVDISVSVEDSGLLDVTVLVGPLGVDEQARLVLDPEIDAGTLSIVVVTSEGTINGKAPAIALLLEAPLRHQLDSLASGAPHRLTAISTRDGQLTLEIEL